ncbi:hypothetical protein N7474_009724 [Penicillium riverlandense]|uniref:uncharacterized protein n=1 Tax=Penicillium riverlandense TaxID=1903569 RepID=UPI002549585D|nr:uncharacterized protein N7474_009724 [Penicillium riverlandense]KAJ5808455.1 hypothetical protein N7474_009724 [Penicillium riverlandense]
MYQATLVKRGVGSPLVMSFCGSLSRTLIAALATISSRSMLSLRTRNLAFLGIICIELSHSGGATLLTGFNFASAIGRIINGCLLMWPAPTTLARPAVFDVINGLTNGGSSYQCLRFFGNIFGSAQVQIALIMMITG